MSKHRYERSPADIERSIHETQAEMDSTIEELRTRLSPREMLGQSLGYIRESGADVGQNLIGQVRSNPLPVALLVASLGWLMSGRRQRGGAGVEGGRVEGLMRGGRGMGFAEAFGEEDQTKTVAQYGKVFQALARVRPRIDETGEDFARRLYPAVAEALELRQEASETPEMFRQRIERALDDLSMRAETVQHRITAAAGEQWRRTREGARHMAEAAAEQTRRVTRQAADLYSEYPLVAGGIALALGALLGAAVPTTRPEREYLGAAGEQLREAAGEAARAARDVAGRAAETAREAGGGGMTPEWSEPGARDIGGRLRQGAEDAARTGREEVERRVGGGREGGGS